MRSQHVRGLPNRNPVEETRTHHRVDPFWDGLWGAGSNAAWISRWEAERMAEAGLTNLRPLADVEEALRVVLRGKRHRDKVLELACLHLWRTLTEEQIAAMVGSTRMMERKARDGHWLWSAGLASLGQIASLAGAKAPLLLRPDVRTEEEALISNLTYVDWLGVTAGVPWRWGSQYDRHNVLAAELALRVAELTSVPVVLGEALCSLSAFRPAGVPIPERSIRAADAMLVREDGLRVLVELTASGTSTLREKAARWADVLAQDVERSMVVVFVVAAHPDRDDSGLLQSARRAIRESVYASTDHIGAAVPDRMMLARWQDWFPSRHHVTDAFESLSCLRPSPGGKPWRPAALLDPFDTPGPSNPDLRAILANVDALYGVPHWLRHGHGPDVYEAYRLQEGFAAQAPKAFRKKLGSAERAALRAQGRR